MGRLEYGRLTEAWKGEASDFTPLLAAQLDVLGSEIGIDLVSIGDSEVMTTGGRRIDIIAQGTDGTEFVVENQYGRADHDHLTRGLAYAVARKARGLIVVAEEHRDEFRALAHYLNELAELDPSRGIAVWLVEAKAVRIGDSPWAPLFAAVVEPNSFSQAVEQAKKADNVGTFDDFWASFTTEEVRAAARVVATAWADAGHRLRLGPNHVVLEAAGPSVNGYRTVIAIYNDGRLLVPFSSYAGQNSGLAVAELITPAFRATANQMFGFDGSERQARTRGPWLTSEKAPALIQFCLDVAAKYHAALEHGTATG